jgi:hypothetical protein
VFFQPLSLEYYSTCVHVNLTFPNNGPKCKASSVDNLDMPKRSHSPWVQTPVPQKNVFKEVIKYFYVKGESYWLNKERKKSYAEFTKIHH